MKIEGIQGDVKTSKCDYCNVERPKGILWIEGYGHSRAIKKLPNGLKRCFPRCVTTRGGIVVPGKANLIKLASGILAP